MNCWHQTARSLAALVVATLGAGCPTVSNQCPLPNTAPDVASGRGEATRSDSAAFNEDASWLPGGLGSVDIGLLSMTIDVDQTGSAVDDLIADAAFPICIPLAEQSATSGSANFIDGGFITDAAHTGGLLLISNDSDVLAGRFAVDLGNNRGEELSFSTGQFRARRR